MKNKTQFKQTPPSKIITLNSEQQLDRNQSKPFRKCRKVFKALRIATTPRFVDQVHIRTQFKEWLDKINDSKDSIEKGDIPSQKYNYLDLSSDKLYRIYNNMREDQKIIKNQTPLDSHSSVPMKQAAPIRINLKDVKRIRSNLQPNRIVLSPKEFHVEICERPQSTLSSRGIIQFRQERVLGRKNILNHSLQAKQRCMTERKELLLTANILEKYLDHSPTTPLSTSKAESSSYVNRSKVKKIWETMGVHQWRNFN